MADTLPNNPVTATSLPSSLPPSMAQQTVEPKKIVPIHVKVISYLLIASMIIQLLFSLFYVVDRLRQIILGGATFELQNGTSLMPYTFFEILTDIIFSVITVITIYLVAKRKPSATTVIIISSIVNILVGISGGVYLDFLQESPDIASSLIGLIYLPLFRWPLFITLILAIFLKVLGPKNSELNKNLV